MLRLIYNELLVITGRWRSYIGFIGISILMPLILWGFSQGGEELHQDYVRELGGTFMVVGSILNSFLATYIIMNTLWIHIPFWSRWLREIQLQQMAQMAYSELPLLVL